ncbi:MAG TPA: hypothetical protein VMN78_09420 [Longimicrobiales bacterium]|nr:hypothetical protein [Longimicrobiales bacterium]
MRSILAAVLLALAPALADAQERQPLSDLPNDVEDRVRAMRADPDAFRLTGPVTIGADSVVAGDLVVERGSLYLAGRVAGDVLVVGGNLVLGQGAVIDGDVLVVDGEIEGVDLATVGGTLHAYGPAGKADEPEFRRRRDDRAARTDDDREDDDEEWVRRRRRHRRDEGGLDVGLSVASNYNRVEGLPIRFGPVIETGGPNRLHVTAQAIWRTQPSESLENEIGWQVRVDQGLFRDRLRLGGEVRSLARPIETRNLNSTEASLAAALFHSDLYDYLEEESWAARVELRPRRAPLHASLTYRQAEHGNLEVSNPWSLLDNDDAWRPQSVVAEGDVSTLAAGLTLDTRDDEDMPVRGILGFAGVERALDQDLRMPDIDLNGTVGGGLPFDDFTLATIDIRGYLPVNRFSTLNLRGVLSGTVEEAVLPPQFQSAFGGIGTLPGFGLLEGACGSRAARVRLVTAVTDAGSELSDETMHPAYGCDRIAMGQLEYRSGFGFDDRHRDDHGDDEDDDDEWWEEFHAVDFEADWSFFLDVTRGWSFGDMTFVDRGDTETLADVGIGLLFEQAGVYAALPVTGDDRSLRVVVRLQRRF